MSGCFHWVRFSLEIKQFGRKGLKLTRREEEVLDLLLRGRTNKDIAQQFRISGFTVRDHVSSLLCKYGVGSRMELIVEIGRLGEGLRGLAGPLHR